MQRDHVFNLRVVGIGGEGIVSLSSLIAETAVAAGISVTVVERPRSAMRLGPITCDIIFHQENIAAFIAPGDADAVLSPEPLDGIMNAAYCLRKGGLALLNGRGTPTIAEIVSGAEDARLSELTRTAEEFGVHIKFVDAVATSLERMGNTLGVNDYLLGALCALEKRFPLNPDQLRVALAAQPGRLYCFERGLAAV